eukprot:12404269-Karenia_brevis.AAC.1
MAGYLSHALPAQALGMTIDDWESSWRAQGPIVDHIDRVLKANGGTRKSQVAEDVIEKGIRFKTSQVS